MRITRPDGSVIEGTAQELAQFEFQVAFSAHAQHMLAQGAVPAKKAEEDHEFVSVEVAKRALTRIKLNPLQLKVLQCLYAADDWVLATELQALISYTPSQFAGLMGAFGRRVNFTPGWVAGSTLFDQAWDHEQACNKYRLPPSVKEAMQNAHLAYDL